MTNNFSTLKNNQASKKFNLIRIEPARYINDSLVSIGGGKYTITFKPNGTTPGIVSQVQENGVGLTLTTGTPTAGQYSYSETTGLLTVYSTPSSSNIICLFYYLFYTSGIFRHATEDPEDSGTTDREWLPRLRNLPSFSFSMGNIINGQLTISSSSINLVNDNNEFQYYLTDNDSFYLKEIRVWSCLEDVENINMAFLGRVTEITLSPTNITINFDDNLSFLTMPALMGDESYEAYFDLESNPSLDPSKDGKPIRFIFGENSRYRSLIIPAGDSVEYLFSFVDYTTMEEAACIDGDRKWGLCRTKSGFLDFTCTLVAFTNNSPHTGFATYTLNASDLDKFLVGDTFVITKGGVTDYMKQIIAIDRSANKFYTIQQAEFAPGDIIQGNNAPCVVIVQNSIVYYTRYKRHYTATVSDTTGGNKYLTIEFDSDLETASPGMAAYDLSTRTIDFSAFMPTDLDYTQDKVYFRVSPARTNNSHGSVVKTILESSGMAVNSASITNANSDLDATVQFSIPHYDEINYKNYYDYVQNICESTFSYLTINNDFEAEYHLFKTPNSSNEITDNEILANTFSTSINYKDIVTKIVAYNPHADDIEQQGFDSSLTSPVTSSSTESSLKAKYLHGIQNDIRLRHVLKDISVPLENIIKVRVERYVSYKLATKTKNIDTILGDEFLLNKVGLLGNQTSDSLKVIDIEKGADQTSITLTDLYNL